MKIMRLLSICLIFAFFSGIENSATEKNSIEPLGNANTSIPAQNQLRRLDPKAEVWIDLKKKRVIVGGEICLNKGVLEMFACVKNTKEHESIISVNSKAYMVHAALLAVNAKPGSPVKYDPQYLPATGQTVRVDVAWKDAEGKVQKVKAQEMIRHVKTRKPMDFEWVFAGSRFWIDDEGTKYYQAENGELICVSNFSTAMMDLPIESSQSTSNLLFEALTEKIPPLGTKVRLILTPIVEKTSEKDKAK